MGITGTTDGYNSKSNESILELELEMNDTINYLIEQRDKAIERLNDDLRNNFYVEDNLTNKLKSIIRFNRQIRTLEAAIIIFREKIKNK